MCQFNGEFWYSFYSLSNGSECGNSGCALLNTSNFWGRDYKVQISWGTHLDIWISLHSLVSLLYSFRLYVEKLPTEKMDQDLLEIYQRTNILEVGFHFQCCWQKSQEQYTADHRKDTDDDTRWNRGNCCLRKSVQRRGLLGIGFKSCMRYWCPC